MSRVDRYLRIVRSSCRKEEAIKYHLMFYMNQDRKND